MQQQYTTDETFRQLCRKMMALALMPRDKVMSSFDEIQDDAFKLPGTSMTQLLEYFEDNLMNDIDLWNVSESDARTNNNCEGRKKSDSVCQVFFPFPKGYHNRMNCRLPRSHPNIWFLISFLQREEKRATSIMIQWSSGASKKKNYRTTAIQNRINTLYKRYNDDLIGASTLLTGLSLVVAKNANEFTNFIPLEQVTYFPLLSGSSFSR